MPHDAFGGAFSSEGAIGSVDPDSGVSLAIPALASEGLAATTVTSGIVADSFPTDTDLLPCPSPPAAVVESSAGCRAPGDLDMRANGVTSALGPA